MALDAEVLGQRLVEHPNFAKLCDEISDRFSSRQGEHPWVREELEQWIAPYREQLTQEGFKSLFQRLYAAVLEAVWRASQVDLPAVDHSLFPGLSSDGLPQVESNITHLDALPDVGAAAADDSIFPDLPSDTQDTDLMSLAARSLMSLPALPRAEVAPPRYPDTAQMPVIPDADLPEELRQAPVAPPLSAATSPSQRYQTITFDEGFYLLDQLTGLTWFMPSGGSEFMPCLYEQGNVSAPLPPEAPLDRRGAHRGALDGNEITVSFPETKEEPAITGFPEAPMAYGLSHQIIDDVEYREHGFSFDDEHGFSFDGDLDFSEPFVEDFAPGPDMELVETSDELSPPQMDPLYHDSFSAILDGHLDATEEEEETFDPPTLPPPPLFSPGPHSGSVPPPAFASQVAEQVPSMYSFEDLSANQEERQKQPTLLPNRMRPGEGASYDALHGFDPLNQEILNLYPYPIARLYESFLSENDPRLRLRLLMLVFIHLIKFSTLPLILQYLRHPRLHDVATHQALLRLQSTRWSAWLEYLRCGVELFQGRGIPFTEELCQAYRRLETERPPQQRFLYTQRFLDPLGEERVTHLHLGLLDALVVYRDSFVHGFTPTVEQAQEDLEIYEPLLRIILEEMRFISKYPLLYTFQQRGEEAFLCYPLMGANPDPSHQLIEVPFEAMSTTRPLFLLDPENPEQTLPLHPLLVSASPRLEDSPIPSQHHTIFLFHGCSGTRMLYHNLWQVPYLTDESFPHWQELLQRSMVPSQEVIPSEAKRKDLVAFSRQWTQRQLEQLKYNQQYYPELTIPRRGLQRVLRDFLSSELQGLVFHGAPGVGKTTFLAQHAEIWMAEERPVVWLRGPHLDSGDIESILASVLGLSQGQVCAQIAELLEPEEPLLLIFDDVELPHRDLSIWDTLDQWLHQLSTSPLADRIKVVFLMHSASFLQKEGLFAQSERCFFSFEDSYLHLQAPALAMEIPAFFPDEAEMAYRRYRNFQNGHGIAPFRPLTSWESLPSDASCCEVLRHPLFLRLAMATYCQQELPPMLQLDELFQQYLEQIIEEKNAPLPIPERLQFLRALLQQFYDKGTRVLSRADLLDSEVPLLVRALQNAHTDSPLIQLLHLGVLVEEWQGERCFISFSCAPLFAFFMTDEWMRRAPEGDASVMFSLGADELLESPLSQVHVFFWLKLLRSQQSPMLCSWLHQHIGALARLLEEFVLRLVRTGDMGWIPFVEEFLLDAPEEALQSLLQIADRLLNTGHEDVAQRFLGVMLQSSSNAPWPPHLEVALLFRNARLCELQGQREKAKALYLKCKTRIDKGSADPLLGQVTLRLASLARQTGEGDAAQESLVQLQSQMDFSDHPELLARIIRQLGNMAYEQGDLDGALEAYKQSLQIDEDSQNLRGIAASLSNLGTVFGSRGDLEQALAHYHRCLEIHQKLGDRKNIATTLNNIGIIYKSQGKHESALGQFLQSLKLREELRLYRDVSTSHNNIILLYRHLGELKQAESHARQNVKLLSRLQDPRVASAHQQLGEIYALQQMIPEAHAQFVEARRCFSRAKDAANEALVLLSLGQLHEMAGELDEALLHYRDAREQFESSQAAVELIAALRSIASVYAQRSQLEDATNELQHALSLAEQLQLGFDVLNIMIELAHVRILRQDIPAAHAYTDRSQTLAQELEAPVGLKDVLTLATRLSIREDNWVKFSELLRQLQLQLQLLPHDPTPQRTAWALFEAAEFCQDLDQERSLELCQKALHSLQGQFFSKREALLSLQAQLKQGAGF